MSDRGYRTDHQMAVAVLLCCTLLLNMVSSDEFTTTKPGYLGDCRLLSLTTPRTSYTLKNPNYPRVQFTREVCWVIHISPGFHKKYLIELTVHDLDLHVTGICGNTSSDLIEARDGRNVTSHLLRRWCRVWKGSMVVTACGPDLLFRSKVSSHSITHGGFNVSYRAVGKDSASCASPKRAWEPRFSRGTVAAIVIVLIFLLIMLAILVLLFYWKKLGPPLNQSVWPPGFQHRRFSNDGIGADEHFPAEQPRRPVSRSASVQLSESMRNISQPLPIGIPQAYKADGTPSSYADNIQVGNPAALQDGETLSASAPASIATTATLSSSASTQASTGLEDIGIAIVSGAAQRDAGIHSIQNPLYEMSLQDSGLPTETPGGIDLNNKSDPLSASTLLESSNSSAVLSSAMAELSEGTHASKNTGGEPGVVLQTGTPPANEHAHVTTETNA